MSDESDKRLYALAREKGKAAYAALQKIHDSETREAPVEKEEIEEDTEFTRTAKRVRSSLAKIETEEEGEEAKGSKIF